MKRIQINIIITSMIYNLDTERKPYNSGDSITSINSDT